MTEALTAQLEKALQETRLLREEIVAERQGTAQARSAPGSAAVPARAASAGSSGRAKGEQLVAITSCLSVKEAEGLRGVLTRPGPAGTWFVKFVDWEGGAGGKGGVKGAGEATDTDDGQPGGGGEEQKASASNEAKAVAGDSTQGKGAAIGGEEGPFPCTRDSPSLMYPLVPVLRTRPAAQQASLSQEPVAAAGVKAPSPGDKDHAPAKTRQKAAPGAPSGSGDDEGGSGEREKRAGIGEAGGVMDTIMRVAVARARLVFNVTTDMLVHWVSCLPSSFG